MGKDKMNNENTGELIVGADFKISQATEKEKSEMELETKLQNEAEGYWELVYASKDYKTC